MFRADPAGGIRCDPPVPDEGFAGRLVEASRVPVCISKDSALLRPRSVVWDEGLRCRNMEPKKPESEQAIARSANAPLR